MEQASPHPQPDFLRMPEAQKEWVVVRTRPRCEKKLELACRQEGIPIYLPLHRTIHRYGGRKREFLVPLFSGYAFCLVDPDQLQWVFQNRYSARVLRTPDQSQLVRQLQNVRTALAVQDVLDVFPHLEEGRPVMIKSGPLKGVEGVVQRIKGKTRVIINVDMIQHGVAMEIDAADLSPA